MKYFLLNIFIAITIPAFAQQESNNSSSDLARNLYENALLQVENLIITQSPTDSLIFYLLSDAKDFANRRKWYEGYEILNTIIELSDENVQSAQSGYENDTTTFSNSTTRHRIPSSMQYTNFPTFPFQLEVGLDYSRQEFELSFVENDSTIAEELQNPYIGLLFNHDHLLANHPISFNHRFRLDDQFIYYSLFGTYQSNTPGGQNRLDFESYFYHQTAQENSDFLDGQLRYTWSKSDYGKRLFYLNLRGRYKWYLQQDSLNNDIISTVFNTYYEHFFNLTNSFYLNMIPEFYKERQELGVSYFQTRAGAFYRIREDYNQYVNVGGEVVYRDFSNGFSDEEYRNRYLSLEPRIEGEFTFSSHLGIGFKAEFENRNYKTADEINPNFHYFSGEGLLKYYWKDFKSIGAGYFYEQQSHTVEDESIKPLVEQEDFYSYGLIVNSEIMNLSGLMVNLEYRLSVRTYPNSEESLFSNYYSDRFIHSLSAFGWIPVGNRWQVQLFANYDNDQDRDNEQNDNRSTILNVGLIYRF